MSNGYMSYGKSSSSTFKKKSLTGTFLLFSVTKKRTGIFKMWYERLLNWTFTDVFFLWMLLLMSNKRDIKFINHYEWLRTSFTDSEMGLKEIT